MRSLVMRFEIAGELFHFLWAQKLWWMIPLIFMLLIIGLFIVFASSTALTPFIYPII
jgi:hypothetical protein